MNKSLSLAKNCLEFLLISIVQNLNMNPEEASGMLANAN
jgi:hypothetical protein